MSTPTADVVVTGLGATTGDPTMGMPNFVNMYVKS